MSVIQVVAGELTGRIAGMFPGVSVVYDSVSERIYWNLDCGDDSKPTRWFSIDFVGECAAFRLFDVTCGSFLFCDPDFPENLLGEISSWG